MKAQASFPPGRIKISDALKALLRKKEFGAITWAEIAKTAGVNEGLIYKYFQDKRNLLHEILKEYLEEYVAEVEEALKGPENSLDKLRQLIWSHLNVHSKNRVFAKILLLEVRNFPGYFQSPTYGIVRRYAKLILDIIQEGITRGEIRDDVSPWALRQVILGAIEHLSLPGVIFEGDISPDEMTENLCKILFEPIQRAKKRR